MTFNWDVVQYREDGKVLLLYRHERIFTEVLVKPGMNVLDVGGWGHFNERVHQEGAFCTVLDNFGPDQYYPDRVKPFSIQADICKLDVLKLSGPYTYDIVTCFETLEHVADQEAAVKNIYSLLRSPGIFAGTVPIPGFCHYLGEPGIKFLNEKELRKLLQDAGFVDIFIEPTSSVTQDGPLSSLYFRGVKQ
jgi:SAM-dependent methyltransferase